MKNLLWRGYSRFAVFTFTLFILFVILNLVLVPIYSLVDSARERQVAESSTELDRQEKLKLVYPGWDEKELDRLFRETWSRALNCAPFVHFIEGAGSGKYVNVDRVGFRYGSQPLPWPPDPGALTIFVFGPSTVFGYNIADDETIPAQMEVLLAEQIDDRPVHVYNFGQAFYYSFQELRLFEQLLLEGYIPDVAVFVHGMNEKNIESGPYRWRELQCSLEKKQDNTPNFLLTLPVNRLLDSFRFRILDQPADQVDNSMSTEITPELTPEEIVEQWWNYHKTTRAIAQGFGIRTLFVWQPSPNYMYDLNYHVFYDVDPGTADGETEPIDANSRIYEIMAQEQTRDDILFLGDIQKDKKEPLYVDWNHYTGAFSAEIADYIVDYMLQMQIVE